jgi:hypothetical protein
MVIGEVGALSRCKSICTPCDWRFRETKSWQRQIAKSKPTKVFAVEARRYPDFAIVVECNETSVEEQIGIGGKQQSVHAIETLVGGLT